MESLHDVMMHACHAVFCGQKSLPYYSFAQTTNENFKPTAKFRLDVAIFSYVYDRRVYNTANNFPSVSYFNGCYLAIPASEPSLHLTVNLGLVFNTLADSSLYLLCRNKLYIHITCAFAPLTNSASGIDVHNLKQRKIREMPLSCVRFMTFGCMGEVSIMIMTVDLRLLTSKTLQPK